MRTLPLCLLALVTLSGNGSAQAPSILNPAAERRVDSILAQLTLEEKVGVLGGSTSSMCRDSRGSAYRSSAQRTVRSACALRGRRRSTLVE